MCVYIPRGPTDLILRSENNNVLYLCMYVSKIMLLAHMCSLTIRKGFVHCA